MEDVKGLMSKFKDCLEDVISDYRNKISDIENEQSFIQSLGDLVNYCKSDFMLLPFYDESILVRVFERVFPLSNIEINKIKAAKYLIDACVNIDKDNFPQYNASLDNVKDIHERISSYYDKLLSENSLASDKDNFSQIIKNLSSIYDLIGEDCFDGLIDDVDCFEQSLSMCGLSNDDINNLLNVAIKSNLEYLDSNGVVIEGVDNDLKNESSIIQDDINDLSSLLGNE